jgi:hypothetical protein
VAVRRSWISDICQRCALDNVGAGVLARARVPHPCRVLCDRMGLLPLHENSSTHHNFVIPTEAERSERSGEPALSEVEGDLVLACVRTGSCRRGRPRPCKSALGFATHLSVSWLFGRRLCLRMNPFQERVRILQHFIPLCKVLLRQSVPKYLQPIREVGIRIHSSSP